jgi:hypothetical protein
VTCYDAIYTDNNTNVLCRIGLTFSCRNLTIQVARYKLVLICPVLESWNYITSRINIELSTMCETRKSTLRYEHNSNLNYIDNQQDRLVPTIRGFKIASLNITSLPKTH